jgi:predicted MFS family arabinose efflux permease
LVCLTLVYTVNFVDRGLIGLLLQPIKEDLRLSDTQLGFLTGIAFGLFYATLGVPIARWADRGNRVTITSIALALWSGTVMLCLFVGNFAQLVAARVAAAVGEAGCFPTTYSLVGDYFRAPAERTRAMAIYMLGNPLSSVLSFVVGGWLNAHYGWRMTFCLMGIPGLVIALLIRLTVADPRQSVSAAAAPRNLRQPPMWDVLKTLWYRRATRHLGLAIILLCTLALGLAPWYAAFLIRSHGVGAQELGIWLGIAFGAGGTVGTLLGGYGSARWFGDDMRGQMRLSAVMIALVVPCFVLFLLLPQKMGALIALIPLQAVIVFFIGPTLALLQQLVPDDMRATTLAVVMLLANLIGMGVGPQMVGIGSDLLEPYVGSDSLRYSMLGMSLMALWAAYHFWMVGKTVKEELYSSAVAVG